MSLMVISSMSTRTVLLGPFLTSHSKELLELQLITIECAVHNSTIMKPDGKYFVLTMSANSLKRLYEQIVRDSNFTTV